MKVKVKLFAALREMAGESDFEIEFWQNKSCGAIVQEIGQSFAHLSPLLNRSMIAVNGAYAEPERSLSDGDEVAILPPVSGG